MRALALVAALFLTASFAGCTQGNPKEDFQATCPAWIKGKSTQVVSLGPKFLYTNQTTQPKFDDWDFAEATYDSAGNPQKAGTGFGDGLLSFQGYPLDNLVFDFRADSDLSKTKKLLYVQDATVRLTFFASDGGYVGEPLEAWDVSKGRSSASHEWTFTSDPAKGYSIHNVSLQVDLANDASEPHPRGVFTYWEWTFDLDRDRDTPSSVIVGYSPDMWYRTCSRQA